MTKHTIWLVYFSTNTDCVPDFDGVMTTAYNYKFLTYAVWSHSVFFGDKVSKVAFMVEEDPKSPMPKGGITFFKCVFPINSMSFCSKASFEDAVKEIMSHPRAIELNMYNESLKDILKAITEEVHYED